MVAPSFVTVTLCPLPVDCKILSYTAKFHAPASQLNHALDIRELQSGDMQEDKVRLPFL